MAEPPTLPGLPGLRWTHGESAAGYDPDDDALTLTAAAGVDWSNDALGVDANHRATLLGFDAPAGDFGLSARVRVVGPRTTFDAAVLGLWRDDDHWAKLCFEFSPPGPSATASSAMVVSVVTDGSSDDANSGVVTDDHVHLRIVRTGAAFAFHASGDGVVWDFVRLFLLAGSGPITVGFMAQAPLGASCEARFDQIRLTEGAPRDLRDGS
jgi:regulation of enolase protein 1 (concanavalin A-like superfamily)